MDKETIINQVVNQAYNNLTSLVDLNVFAFGGYFGMIIPKNEFKNLLQYSEEIMENLFQKFCDTLSSKVTTDDMEFVIHKSFCFNNPSNELIKDCFKIVNTKILNKKSSNNTTLFEFLKSLQDKYNEEENSKALNTIFDILLDYYSIVKR